MPAKKYNQPQEVKPDAHNIAEPLKGKPIAAYYRQSTTKQIGNESTAMQREDLPKRLIEMGWREDLIIHIPEGDGKGVSGTLPIDQRPGLKEIMVLGRAGKIGAVAAVKEDRLFRDQYLTQVTQFLEMCAEHEIFVILPHFTYCFHGPVGNRHRMMFQLSCEEGWNYIEGHVLGRMLAARNRKAERGLWTGGCIATGYMIELATSEYKICEAVAAIVREWFRLFIEVYRGNTSATWKHLKDKGPLLPDFEALSASLPKQKDGRPIYLLQVPNNMRRAYPTRSGLESMLTNAAYIGWWSHKGVIVRDADGQPKQTHDPIVDEAVFWQAFNYISHTRLDGTPNSDHKKRCSPRPRQSSDPRRDGTPRPFLEGLLVSPDEFGILRPASCSWNKATGHYEYVGRSRESDGMESKLWCKTAARLDSVVDDMLSTMPNRKDVAAALKEKWAAELAINFDSQRKPIEENIARAKKGQADTVKRLDAMTDPDLIRREEGKYTAFKHDIARYEAQLADINRLEADRDKTTDFMRKWFEVTANYAVLSREDRRLVLEAVAESVEARVYGNDLEITLILRGGKPIKRTIGLKYSGWTAAEQDLLLELSKKGASPLMLCAALPDRTWRSIILKHRGLTGSCLSKSNSPLDLSETFWDRYGNRVQVIEDTPLPDGFDWKKLGDGSVRLVDLSKEGGFEDGIFDNYSISDR